MNATSVLLILMLSYGPQATLREVLRDLVTADLMVLCSFGDGGTTGVLTGKCEERARATVTATLNRKGAGIHLVSEYDRNQSALASRVASFGKSSTATRFVLTEISVAILTKSSAGGVAPVSFEVLLRLNDPRAPMKLYRESGISSPAQLDRALFNALERVAIALMTDWDEARK